MMGNRSGRGSRLWKEVGQGGEVDQGDEVDHVGEVGREGK